MTGSRVGTALQDHHGLSAPAGLNYHDWPYLGTSTPCALCPFLQELCFSLRCAWAILYVYISSPVSCLDLGPIWLIVLSLVSNLSLAALDWIHHLPLSGTADRSCYQDPALVRYMGLEPCFCCSHLQLPAHPPLCSSPARAAPWHGKHLFSFLQKF